ncbi:hypothetical protein RJT34_02902 [Clitoria ternatea]|uniref:Uncharacterized protein n=1 Tax=Clitoria ternatea TaxID=43366 RepID=A0AAN9KL39_CLITE
MTRSLLALNMETSLSEPRMYCKRTRKTRNGQDDKASTSRNLTPVPVGSSVCPGPGFSVASLGGQPPISAKTLRLSKMGDHHHRIYKASRFTRCNVLVLEYQSLQ